MKSKFWTCPAISLLGKALEISYPCASGELRMFTAALPMKAKAWKQSKCPPTVKRTIKACGTVKQLNLISSGTE